MIAGLDSSYSRPTPATAQAARAAGVRIWCGYLTTKPNVGIASPWDQASFENARLCGADPIAWCSGWDDPVALKQKAAAWRVRLGLDCEGGIRGDGPWVQGFLDASGAGLYGNAPVFPGRRAPFFVEAAYPGFDPGRTWISGDPGVPHGWQWEGSHMEFGDSVDRGWYDDWFLQGGQDDMTPEEHDKLDEVWNFLYYGSDSRAPGSSALFGLLTEANAKVEAVALKVQDLAVTVAKLSTPPAIDPKAVAAELAPLLPHLSPADVDAIAKASIVALGKTLTPPA